MSRAIIEVERLSKRYRLGLFNARSLSEEAQRLWGRIRGSSVDAQRDSTSDFWALRDASFSVQPGEVLGVIGRNGAGKSTLLKILSRITEPTSGEVRVRGRVAALLEVGTGFHPELTGRENIYLNGAILGMTRTEIVRKFDEIVDFAGVEKFLDTPVKRYSSGMHVRLAFAVAAHLEPEILIVDEVLAVGDAEFQKKCLNKMRQVSSGDGRTVLFVSHNMAAIQSLCEETILLDGGRIAQRGPAADVVRQYLTARSYSDESVVSLADVPRDPGLQPVIRSGTLNGQPIGRGLKVAPETRMSFSFEIELPQKMTGCTLGVHFIAAGGVVVYSMNTRWILRRINLQAGKHRLDAILDSFPLSPGTYGLSLGFATLEQQVDWLELIGDIQVVETDVFGTGELPWNGQGYVISRPLWTVNAQ